MLRRVRLCGALPYLGAATESQHTPYARAERARVDRTAYNPHPRTRGFHIEERRSCASDPCTPACASQCVVAPHRQPEPQAGERRENVRKLCREPPASPKCHHHQSFGPKFRAMTFGQMAMAGREPGMEVSGGGASLFSSSFLSLCLRRFLPLFSARTPLHSGEHAAGGTGFLTHPDS